MKRIFFAFVCLIIMTLLCACGTEQLSYDESTGNSMMPTESSLIAESVTPSIVLSPTPAPYVPDIFPDIVGIYIPKSDGTSARQKITEFKAERVAGTDIDCFEVFASDSQVIEGGSFAKMWQNVWDSHGDYPDAKIGFKIEFDLASGELISEQILKPSDSAEFFDYLEVYIYDDINQDGGWYTHLDDEDITEQTIMSSIKLTSGKRIDEVGDIKLSAFIYDNTDNFNSDGKYLGNVISMVKITE